MVTAPPRTAGTNFDVKVYISLKTTFSNLNGNITTCIHYLGISLSFNLLSFEI